MFLPWASWCWSFYFSKFFLFYWLVDINFIKSANCGDIASIIYCFFDRKWDSSEYLSAITNFYTTIIMILLAFLAVLATFTFLVIRTSTIQHAKEAMESEVERYFHLKSTDNLINSKLETVIENRIVPIISKEIKEKSIGLESRIRNFEMQMEILIIALGDDYDISGTVSINEEASLVLCRVASAQAEQPR